MVPVPACHESRCTVADSGPRAGEFFLKLQPRSTVNASIASEAFRDAVDACLRARSVLGSSALRARRARYADRANQRIAGVYGQSACCSGDIRQMQRPRAAWILRRVFAEFGGRHVIG